VYVGVGALVLGLAIGASIFVFDRVIYRMMRKAIREKENPTTK